MKAQGVLALLLVGCGGGFDVGALGAPSRIEGRLVDASGQPAAGARVSLNLAADAAPIAFTDADAEGRFWFTTEIEAALMLGAHDGAGNGVVRDIAAVPGVTADLGDLVVRDLGLEPEILGLSGLGYEERVSPTALDGQFLSSPIDDGRRWIFSGGSQSAATAGAHVLDMTPPARVISAPPLTGASLWPRASFVAPDGTPVAVVTTEQGAEEAVWWVSPGIEPVELLRFGAQSRQRLNSAYGRGDRVTLLVEENSADHRVMTFNAEGDILEERTLPSDFASEYDYSTFSASRYLRRDRREGDATWLDVYDLATGREQSLGPFALLYVRASSNEGSLYLEAQDLDDAERRLVRYDGERAIELARASCAAFFCFEFSLLADGVYLRVPGERGFRVMSYDGVSRERFDLTGLDPDLEVPCLSPFDPDEHLCGLRWRAGDRASFFLRAPELPDFRVVDVDGARRVRELRFTPDTSNLQSPEGLQTLPERPVDVWSRRDANGSSQVLVAPRGAPESAFQRGSWFPRPHAFAGLGPEGRWVYTTMSDPLSGRVQVFRTAVDLP